MSLHPVFLHEISNDLIVHIFSKMDVQTLGRCCQVQKNWNTLITETNALWKEFAEKEYGQVPNDRSIKVFLNEQAQKVSWSLVVGINCNFYF